MNKQDLIDMKLHEVVTIEEGRRQVVRVAGGWVYLFLEYEMVNYSHGSYQESRIRTSCFVPEFVTTPVRTA